MPYRSAAPTTLRTGDLVRLTDDSVGVVWRDQPTPRSAVLVVFSAVNGVPLRSRVVRADQVRQKTTLPGT